MPIVYPENQAPPRYSACQLRCPPGVYAEKFKFAKIADLLIQPSAAYFLAAPSIPDEARQKGCREGEAEEEITFAVAREIVAKARKKKRPRRQKPVASDKLAGRLVTALERYRDRGRRRNSRSWPGTFGSSPNRSMAPKAVRKRISSRRQSPQITFWGV